MQIVCMILFTKFILSEIKHIIELRVAVFYCINFCYHLVVCFKMIVLKTLLQQTQRHSVALQTPILLQTYTLTVLVNRINRELFKHIITLSKHTLDTQFYVSKVSIKICNCKN